MSTARLSGTGCDFMTEHEQVIAEELTRRITIALDKNELAYEQIQAFEMYVSACHARHRSEPLLVRLFLR